MGVLSLSGMVLDFFWGGIRVLSEVIGLGLSCIMAVSAPEADSLDRV